MEHLHVQSAVVAGQRRTSSTIVPDSSATAHWSDSQQLVHYRYANVVYCTAIRTFCNILQYLTVLAGPVSLGNLSVILHHIHLTVLPCALRQSCFLLIMFYYHAADTTA